MRSYFLFADQGVTPRVELAEHTRWSLITDFCFYQSIISLRQPRPSPALSTNSNFLILSNPTSCHVHRPFTNEQKFKLGSNDLQLSLIRSCRLNLCFRSSREQGWINEYPKSCSRFMLIGWEWRNVDYAAVRNVLWLTWKSGNKSLITQLQSCSELFKTVWYSCVLLSPRPSYQN